MVFREILQLLLELTEFIHGVLFGEFHSMLADEAKPSAEVRATIMRVGDEIL